MRYLLPGHEPQERVDILVSLTDIDSDNKIAALSLHLVKGRPSSTAAILNDVDPSNFAKTVAVVEAVAAKVERIKEIDGVNRGSK